MTAPIPAPNIEKITPLVNLGWDNTDWAFTLTISMWVLAAIIIIIVTLLVWRYLAGGFTFKSFEIDQADIGIGNQKFSFKPNMMDKQVAYAIWVELSTRKIGLPIDFEHDVISEIYESWYGFFAVTRDLVKGISANKVKRDSTQKIIRLSIEVLNEGLRPHLTKWQARFRHWYDRELEKYDKGGGEEILDPQLIQAKFPKYDELKEDMERVNQALMKYRGKMHSLVLKD